MSLVVSIAGLLLACASESGGRSPQRLDYCDCEMWGVTGVDPGPGYRPPPRPAACRRISRRGPKRDCPVPP